MKKVLVCGATGFIGRNIAESLAESDDYQVYGVYHEKEPWNHPKISFRKADLREKEQVDRVVEGMDIIIQAAATTSGSKDIVSQPYIHVTDNAVMNSLLFRSAYEAKTEHVIFLSCGVMYQPSEIPRKESDLDLNDTLVPQYFGVGWTKIYIEKMCEFYAGISDTKYTVLRHSNIYGPYDKYDYEHSHMFGATVRKVMDAEAQGSIVVWGEGNEKRDLLYIDDLVDFMIKAIHMQTDSFQLCNVGYGQAYSVNEVVTKMIEMSEKKLSIVHDLTKPSITTNLTFDIEKANILFGWKPKVSLEEGIRKTMQWYQNEKG